MFLEGPFAASGRALFFSSTLILVPLFLLLPPHATIKNGKLTL